jgi:hypothetical protein
MGYGDPCSSDQVRGTESGIPGDGEMTPDEFASMRRELAGLRKRAKDLEEGRAKGVEIADTARYMVYAIDRLKMLLDEAERVTKRG